MNRFRKASPLSAANQFPDPTPTRIPPMFLPGYLAAYKASLSGDFMTLLPMHQYFENSAEEFHPHKTLSTPIKLLSSLFIDTVPRQPI